MENKIGVDSDRLNDSTMAILDEKQPNINTWEIDFKTPLREIRNDLINHIDDLIDISEYNVHWYIDLVNIHRLMTDTKAQTEEIKDDIENEALLLAWQIEGAINGFQEMLMKKLEKRFWLMKELGIKQHPWEKKRIKYTEF